MRDRNQLFGWWYVCIGIGFALLALRSVIAGSRPWPIMLRSVAAAGFIILGMVTLKTSRRS
jgi:hypothetical protein